MKKAFSAFLIFVLLFSFIVPSTGVQSSSPIKVTLDGKPINFDSQPFMENGRTMIPFKAIFEALGAVVSWDESNKAVTGTKDGIKITLFINKSSAFVNDAEVGLDAPATIRNGRTFVPVRFIAENLGVRVYWDAIAKTVVLLSKAVDPADDRKYITGSLDLSPDTTGELTFWHFNRDEAPSIQRDFENRFKNIDLIVSVIPDRDQQYANKLTSAVRSGSGVPDVMSVESAFAKRFINMDNCFMDITDKVGDITDNMYQYTVDFGKDDSGKLKALSHQIATGAIGYKMQLAKKYLGTDDPDRISAMLSSPEQILDTAKKLKQASGGKVALFPSWEELKKVYLGGRSKGWVVNGNLNIDNKVLDYMDLAKTMRNNKYESGYDAWSPGWSSAIKNDGNAMCWAIPTWGVPWIIGSNDPKAKDGGRWGLAKPMNPYFWGGTWYGVSKTCQNKYLALGFVRYFTSDEEHLENWSRATGDIPNSKKLLKRMGSDNKTIDCITGKNPYKVFGSLAEGVNGNTYTMYDDTIESAYYDCMRSYLQGKISTKDKLISEFKRRVKNSFKDINVN